MDQVRDATNRTARAFDQGLDNTADAIKSGTASASRTYGRVQHRAENFMDTAAAHAQATEEAFFDNLRCGVVIASENRGATYATLGTAVALLSPGLRGFLFRQSFGRLRSQENVLRSAERKARDVGDKLTYQQGESGKLDQRLEAALSQWQAGLSKTRSTASQMQSLASSVSRTEKQASSVVHTLRYLPGGEALKLRAEVATQLAAAQRQRAKLDKQLWNLTKQGV